MNLTQLRSFLFAIVLATLMAAGCGTEKKGKEEKAGNESASLKEPKLAVVATTGMLADAVRNIGGDHVAVTALMGPGVDPHLYKASEGDVTRLASADVIVYNGLHLEGKMGEVLEKMARKRPVIAAGEFVAEEKLMSPPEFEGQHDPHIWFDLGIWADVVESLGRQLAEQDPANKEDYLANTRVYADTVRYMHDQVKQQVATIPEGQRVLITAHDAFGYFGKVYEIEVRGLQGISTVSEYGLQDVTNLVDFIVDRKVKAIFVESSVPRKSIEAVQAGARQKGHEVTIGGELFSDALGEVGTEGETYLGMVHHNVRTIVDALR